MVENCLANRLLYMIAGNQCLPASLIFGSQIKGFAGDLSDFDFQIIANRHAWLNLRPWISTVFKNHLEELSERPALGGARKFELRSRLGSADIVFVSQFRMELACACVAFDLHKASKWLADMLSPLVLIIGSGFRIIKGGHRWELFYRRIVREISIPRLSDNEVEYLSRIAYNDGLWAVDKCRNGESFSAIRILFASCLNINLRLLNELRLRRAEKPTYDGRRAELVLPLDQLQLMLRLPKGFGIEEQLILCELCKDATGILRTKLLLHGSSRNRVGSA